MRGSETFFFFFFFLGGGFALDIEFCGSKKIPISVVAGRRSPIDILQISNQQSLEGD